MDKNYSYPGTLYGKAYILFISTVVQTVYFCSKLGSFYLPFIYWPRKKRTFSAHLFTGILKQSRYLDFQIVFIYKWLAI